MKNLAAIALCLLGLAASSVADPTEEQATIREKLQKLAEGLKYQEGEITLKDGLAKIHLSSDFRYLDPQNAGIVLNTIWGNPPENDTLGMLVPAQVSVASAEGWGIVITYKEDGYVKDNDAAKMDYPKLLKQMQEATQSSNEERKKQGYPAMELVGWATPPRYDQATHKMYWAKELRVGEGDENTLNYNIRMLGRRGVLVLNAVAAMSQLQEIEAATPAVLAMVNFQEGHRYTDFDGSTDKVAAYGLAALLVGGVAAKVGLFKGLLVALLAAKKVVIVAFVAIASFVKRLFGKKSDSQSA